MFSIIASKFIGMSKLTSYIVAAGAVWAAFMGFMARAESAGRKQAKLEAKESDYEMADEIRSAARRARADERMRELDGDERGYRD